MARDKGRTEGKGGWRGGSLKWRAEDGRLEKALTQGVLLAGIAAVTDGKANSDAITERPTRIVGHYVCNGCQLDCGSKQDKVVLVIDEPLPNPSRLCFFLPCRRGITRSSLSADNCFGGLLEYLGGEGGGGGEAKGARSLFG